jgi:hypothetical protein
METGLFEIQADHIHDCRENRQLLSDSRDVIHTLLRRVDSDRNVKADNTVEFARCFLRLANLPSFALDRLSRYETTLWRQAGRILFALDTLDRRKPQERDAIVMLAAHRDSRISRMPPRSIKEATRSPQEINSTKNCGRRHCSPAHDLTASSTF